ncbi:hypothetical protein BDR03DRAFT_77963 [Suillus americanus]|nr:hypothetical protein BDR03DRAFT_77963 [Suillus americanus]
MDNYRSFRRPIHITRSCVKESKFIIKGILEADYMDEYWDTCFVMARPFLRSTSIQVFLLHVLL